MCRSSVSPRSKSSTPRRTRSRRACPGQRCSQAAVAIDTRSTVHSSELPAHRDASLPVSRRRSRPTPVRPAMARYSDGRPVPRVSAVRRPGQVLLRMSVQEPGPRRPGRQGTARAAGRQYRVEAADAASGHAPAGAAASTYHPVRFGVSVDATPSGRSSRPMLTANSPRRRT